MSLQNTQSEPTQRDTPLDCEKNGPRTEAIRSLLLHARDDFRLAELIASEDSLWHLAESCHNLRTPLQQLISSKLEGE